MVYTIKKRLSYTLKRPRDCLICNSTELHRQWNPERWVCNNNHVVLSRKIKNPTGVCRKCGTNKRENEQWFSNICKLCKKIEGRKSSAVQWRHNYKIANRKRVQESPEEFIKYLLLHVRKPRTAQKKRYRKDNQRFVVDLTIDILINLYYKQNGKCAISGLDMVHKFNSMYSISIDRIDGNVGYLDGNVQFVCQAINFMKNKRSNEEALEFVNKIRSK